MMPSEAILVPYAPGRGAGQEGGGAGGAREMAGEVGTSWEWFCRGGITWPRKPAPDHTHSEEEATSQL